MDSFEYTIGIDEAGRGPIAGPVAVGAFVFLNPKSDRMFRGVKESKQLTEAEREEWFTRIVQAQSDGHVNFCVVMQSEKVIDGRGLAYAIKKSLADALEGLHVEPANARVLLDGGLKAPTEYANQQTIIRGDEKKKVIALASICAKVTRDRHMRKMAKKYSGYGFDVHKGYGTAGHYEALERLGILPIHRRSFLKQKSQTGV